MIFAPETILTVRELCGLLERIPDANAASSPERINVKIPTGGNEVSVALDRVEVDRETGGTTRVWVYAGKVAMTSEKL